jgi:hypothetical protein
MQERGVEVDHSTINCWVLKYAPELNKRIRPYLKPTNDSWRVDETYIEIQGWVERSLILLRLSQKECDSECRTVDKGAMSVRLCAIAV